MLSRPTVIGGQALIVNFGGAAFQVVRIGGRDWAISIILGLIALPVAVLIRLLPPGPFERAIIKLRLYPDPNAPLPSHAPAADDKKWGEGIQRTIDNLQMYSQIRGGRARSSSIIRKSRTKQLSKLDIHPSSLMVMMPSLVLGSVGAGWRPEGSLSDPAASDPSHSTAQLYETGHLQPGKDVFGAPLSPIQQGQDTLTPPPKR